MSRGRRQKDRAEPERRCIATGQSQPCAQLIRFVVGPEDALFPDLSAKLPGRGIWISATKDALTKAQDKRLFARAARTKVQVPENLISTLEKGLVRRVTDHISLARKAGRAVAGYEKVRGWLQTEEAAVLIQASDGSERGKTKLRLPEDIGPTLDCLTAHELGLSFGRDHVIHAALGAGGLTRRIVEDANRLSGLRGTVGAFGPGKD